MAPGRWQPIAAARMRELKGYKKRHKHPQPEPENPALVLYFARWCCRATALVWLPSLESYDP